jgi:putative Mg2+ transporter-C (MgtC) family protein
LEYHLTMALRLLTAAILGGLIGIERESLNKAAGFRTHTLVAVGSCLIMITSIEMYTRIGEGFISDPGRIAAQVVSGIGFLGAGTIMRSGHGIKGLTTAASLWVVAGIGLAVGAGNYFTSATTTVIVFFVLVYMSRLEGLIKSTKKKDKAIEVIIKDRPGQLGLVSTCLGNMDVHIRSVQLNHEGTEDKVILKFLVNIPYCLQIQDVVSEVKKIDGVYNAYIC